MKKSIAIKIIFNLAAAISLLLFVEGVVLIKIYKNILAEFKIPEETVSAIIQKNIIFLTVILAFLIVILIIAIYFGIKKIVISPVKKLQESAEMIAKGNLDHQADIEEEGGEINLLAKSFNVMTQKLKASYSGLEQKVKERTEEIVQKVNDLEKMKIALYNILEDLEKNQSFLKEERDRSQAIVSSMGEGLLLIDKDYKIILLNNKAENLLGVSAREAIGRDMKDVITALKGNAVLREEERPVVKMFNTGQTISVDVEDDFYYQISSGVKFPVGLIVTPLRGDGITGAVVIFRDISEEKKLDESKTNFISVSSHQLRTPLTSIRWFSEMLLDGEAGNLNKEQKDFVEKIYQSGERMVNLVDLLLQIARVEMGRIRIEPEPIDLKDITQKMVSSLKNILDLKSQRIEIKTNPDSIPSVQMDKEMVWQVIQNFISNALRYSPAGSVVSVSIALKDNFIEYSVQDNGIGVPENQKNRLFERFFRADNAVKAVPEGSGLGLFLVKALIEGWGGKIWFESEEGKGATFFFTVPLEGMKPKEGEVTLKV